MNQDITNHQDEHNQPADAALKLRHERFVEGYLANGGNATEAARYAGYSQKPDSLKSQACRLLKKPEIIKRIRQRMLEGARVHTDEIIGVLASRMRGNIMDVIDENGQVDLEAIRALDLGHLVKKLTIVKKQICAPGTRNNLDPGVIETMTLELQSDSNAVNHLARALRADTSCSRDETFKRLIYKARDELIEFDGDLDNTEPGLSPDEVFERFAKAQSANYGLDLTYYKDPITKDLTIGSAEAPPPAKSAAAGSVGP